jgi:hypothetical protein
MVIFPRDAFDWWKQMPARDSVDYRHAYDLLAKYKLSNQPPGKASYLRCAQQADWSGTAGKSRAVRLHSLRHGPHQVQFHGGSSQLLFGG